MCGYAACANQHSTMFEGSVDRNSRHKCGPLAQLDFRAGTSNSQGSGVSSPPRLANFPKYAHIRLLFAQFSLHPSEEQSSSSIQSSYTNAFDERSGCPAKNLTLARKIYADLGLAPSPLRAFDACLCFMRQLPVCHSCLYRPARTPRADHILLRLNRGRTGKRKCGVRAASPPPPPPPPPPPAILTAKSASFSCLRRKKAFSDVLGGIFTPAG